MPPACATASSRRRKAPRLTQVFRSEGKFVVEFRSGGRAFAVGDRWLLGHRFIDLALPALQQRFTFARDPLAFFEKLGRTLQLDGAALELLDDRVDTRELLLEVLRQTAAHSACTVSTRA